jgi:uncharacterized protein YjeT (DUF2065 family)
MAIINYLTELIGFSFVVVAFALLLNPKQAKHIFLLVEDETYAFLSGIIAFVMGIAILLFYNVWSISWTVVITIFGWLSLIKGIILLCCPDLSKKWANKIKGKDWLQIAYVVFVFVGLVLIYCGFTL